MGAEMQCQGTIFILQNIVFYKNVFDASLKKCVLAVPA